MRLFSEWDFLLSPVFVLSKDVAFNKYVWLWYEDEFDFSSWLCRGVFSSFGG